MCVCMREETARTRVYVPFVVIIAGILCSLHLRCARPTSVRFLAGFLVERGEAP